MSTRRIELETADITERLVGITPVYLQNFVQRGLFGLRASAQSGKVRAKRRLFSREDVFGIGLVWLLFEAGLRRKPIARVLIEVGGTPKADANRAAQKLLAQEAEFLVILRVARPPSKTPAQEPNQELRVIRGGDMVPKSTGSAIELVIPVGEKFRDISRRLEILFGG
jgi:hypothetical protein